MRSDCTGSLLPKDYRRPRCDEIVIHRNTVADLYRGRNLDFVGDDCLATWLFHRDAPEGSREHFRIFPYHFFVDRDGVIHQCLPYTVRGQHAKGKNSSTVGVAIGWDCRISAPPEHVLEAVAECVARIRADFGQRCAIVEHDPLKPCPGPFLDMADLDRRALEHERKR